MICTKCWNEIDDDATSCCFCDKEDGEECPDIEIAVTDSLPKLPYSKLAITSIVLAIGSLALQGMNLFLAFCGLLVASIALTAGIMSVKRIKPGKAKGKYLAKAGVIISIPGIIISIVFIGMCIDKNIKKSRRMSCLDNLKHVGLALMQYSWDNKHLFPDKNGYAGLQQLVGSGHLDDKYLHCPACKDIDGKTSYIYMGGFQEGSSHCHGNYDEPPLALDRPGNHRGYMVAVFKDGHIEILKTNAKTVVEFIDMIKNRNPDSFTPKFLKKLYEKAAQADREQLQR